MDTPTISALIYLQSEDIHIAECIRALKAQEFTDFECIIADDAIRDKTVLRALRAISKDPRFMFVHFNHPVGPGVARNALLEKAHARYVWFPLAEDMVLPTYLKEVAHAVVQDPDVIISGVSHDMFNHKNEFSHTKTSTLAANTIQNPSASFLLSLNNKQLLHALYNKFFKRSLCDNISFEVAGDAATEDFFFQLALFEQAKTVMCIESTGYHFKHHVSREAYLDTTINSFLARHRRVAALYELLRNHDEAAADNIAELQDLYETYILDELVRRTNPQNHLSTSSNAEWVSFLKSDPLFIELIQNGKKPKGFFKKRFHQALTSTNAKAPLHFAHAVEYGRSFGPGNKARNDT